MLVLSRSLYEQLFEGSFWDLFKQNPQEKSGNILLILN